MATKLFPQLGIAEALAGKSTNAGVATVAKGETEIAIQPVSELLHVPGTDFVGTIPQSIQYISVFSAARVAGSSKEDQAKQLIDFLVGADFQGELPLSNFVYPVREGVALPQLFTDFAPPVADPLTLSPQDIAAHRDQWISTWTQTVLR